MWTYVVSPIAGGSTWPLTDEDLVRLRAQAWRDLQALLLRVGQNTSVSLTDMAMLWDGPSAEAYRQRAYRVLGAVQQLVDGAGDIADQADDAALAIEYEKNTIVLSVIACCFELAAILASMFFTGGLSALFGAGPILVARGIVERVFLQTMQRLSGKFLGRLAVEGLQEGLQEVFTSVMAQLAQILEGTRDGFDGSLIRDSGLGGAAGGVAGDLTAPFVRGGGKALDNVSNPVARNVGDIALQGTHDSFANSVGNITVNGLVYGQAPTLGDLVPGPEQIVSGGIREKIGDRAHQAYEQIGDAAGWSNLTAPVVAPPPGTTSPPTTTAPPVATSPTTTAPPVATSPTTTAPPAGTTPPVATRPPGTAAPPVATSPPGTAAPPSGTTAPPVATSPPGTAAPPSGTTAPPSGNVPQSAGDGRVEAGPSASPPGADIQAPPTGVDSPGPDIGSPAADPTARRPEVDLGAGPQAGGPGSSTGTPGPTPVGNSPLPGTGSGQPDLVGSGAGQTAPSAGPTGDAGLAQSRTDPVGSAPPATGAATPSVPAGPQLGQAPAVVPGPAAGTPSGTSAPPTSASPLTSTPPSTPSGRSSSTTGQSSVPGRDRPPSGIGRVDGPPAGDPERPGQHATDPADEPLLVPADPEAWAAAGPREPVYPPVGRPDPEDDPGAGPVLVGAGRPVDTSWTALEIPGAPSGVGRRNADAVFADLLSSLDRGIVGVPRPTRTDRAARTVRVPRLGGGPELLYTVGPAPSGTRAMRSQVVERDVDGTPVIRVVISDRLPGGADLGHGLQQRDLWLARILVHEPTEADALRKTGFVSRLRRLVRNPGGGTWTPHDEGHRAEVRYLVGQVMELETAGRRLAVREARRQLGLLLDHMGVGIPDPAASAAARAAERLSRLALPPAELAVVTPMLAADAPWRSDLLPGERRRVRRALQAVADDLVSVGRGAPGRDPLDIRFSWVRNQGVEMRIGDRPPVIVDTRPLTLRLAHSGLHGSALSALALDELGVALSTVLAAVDDPGLRQDPRFARSDLLIAHALAHRYDRLAARPPQRPGTLEETLRRFRVRVATLTAAEAFELVGAVQDADLASPLRQRTVTALVRETVATVYGDGTDSAPGQVEVLSGSRVRLTPPGQRPVELALPQSVADLAGAEGSDLDAVRAELAGHLGARLAGPFDRARPWRRTIGGDVASRGALTALTRLHLDPATTAGTRAAAERQFHAVLTGSPYGRESGAERVLAGLAPEVRNLWQRLAGPDPAGSPEETHALPAQRQSPANPRQATPQEVEEKLAALGQQLRTRWESGGSGGRLPRGGSVVRGMEPLALTGESLRVRIHTREGRWYDAEIRVGDPGGATDQTGNRLPAFSQIVTDRGSGETEFRMWIPADRPNNDDLAAMSEREAEELVIAAGRLNGSRNPEQGQESSLTPGELPVRWLRRVRLSPQDVDGVTELETKVRQLALAIHPDERARLARAIEALRRSLGLDPARDGRSARRRWKIVDRLVRTGDFDPATRRYWDALHRPGWRNLVLRHGVAAYLDEYAGQRVRVADDGYFEVSRGPGRAPVRLRLVFGFLPPTTLVETRRRRDGSFLVRVPRALGDDVRAIGPRVVMAVAEATSRDVRSVRRAERQLDRLAEDVTVPEQVRRLGRSASAQWTGVTAQARAYQALARRQAPDPETAVRLHRARQAEHTRLVETLRSMAVLEGQPEFTERWRVISESKRAVPQDPGVAALLHRWERPESDPELVLDALSDVASDMARYAGARGAELRDGGRTLRIMLDDDQFTSHDLPVRLDLPVDGPRFVELAGDSRQGWTLRLRPDAGMDAVGSDGTAALADLVRQGLGEPDSGDRAVEAVAAQLRYLSDRHRVSDRLARQAIRAKVGALVDSLRVGDPDGWSDRRNLVVSAGERLAGRMADRRLDRAREHVVDLLVGRSARQTLAEVVAPHVPDTGAPPLRHYFPGRIFGAMASIAATVTSGTMGGRSPTLMTAQVASSTVGNALVQPQQDHALRSVEERAKAAKAHRDRLESRVRAAASTNAASTQPSTPAQPSGPPTVPRPGPGPFYRKRILPAVTGALVQAGMMLDAYGGRAATGLAQPLLAGAASGASDHLPERPEKQARADRKHEVGQRPDGKRDAKLAELHHVAAEARARLARQVGAGTLDPTGGQTELDGWRQVKADLERARQELRADADDHRQALRKRRRLRRMLWKGTLASEVVGRPVRAAGRAADSLARRVTRRQAAASSSTAGTPLPPGMAPASHYRWRSVAPTTISAAATVGMNWLLTTDPSSFSFVVTTGVASALAGLGLGQGWVYHRQDEIEDESSLAALRTLRHVEDGLAEVEQILGLLGDPHADPGGPPAPAGGRGSRSRWRRRSTGAGDGRTSTDPQDSHFLSVSLMKHGPAAVVRVAAIVVAGNLLLPEVMTNGLDRDVLIAVTAALEAGKETVYGIGEALYRRWAASRSAAGKVATGRDKARLLPYTRAELAAHARTLAAEGADLAEQARNPGSSAPDPDPGDPSSPHVHATEVPSSRFVQAVLADGEVPLTDAEIFTTGLGPLWAGVFLGDVRMIAEQLPNGLLPVHVAGSAEPVYFRAEAADLPSDLVARTEQRAGTVADPYVIQVSRNIRPADRGAVLPRAVAHEIRHTLLHRSGHAEEEAERAARTTELLIVEDQLREDPSDSRLVTDIDALREVVAGLSEPGAAEPRSSPAAAEPGTEGEIAEPPPADWEITLTEGTPDMVVHPAGRRNREATSFVITADWEARIGAYLLSDPASRAAARDAVVRLREVLRALNPGDHEAVDNAFLRDDPRASGQVGPEVRIDALVADGTTRELMTALYNAAFLSEVPTDFVHSVLRLAGTGEPGWRTMRDAGIDTGALAGYLEFVARAKGFAAGDPSYHDVFVSRDFTNKQHLAGYFGRHGDEAARDLAIDLLRQKRPLDARRPYQVTRGDLQRLGVDLGKFELAYQAKILGHVPESETVLPWESGEARFVPDHMTEWYEKVVHELGMPVLAGPAGSASRLYVINDLINPGADHEAFLGAVTGWMLAGRNHSSYEIVQALRGVGYGKEGAPTKIADPADLYQSVPGLKVSPREAPGAAADGAGRPSAPGRASDPHHGTEKPTGHATVPTAASPAGGEHPGSEPEPDREGTTWDIPEFPRTLPDGDPLLEPTFTIDTPTRRAFRQGLIDKALANATPPEDGRPVLYLMGGGVASGKSTVLHMLQESGQVPKENVAFLSPDEFKEPIPEYKLVIAAGDSMASSAVQSESGIMFGTARDEAIRRGVNIICDVTLSNPSGGLRTIQKAIDAGYEVRLYGVTADVASAVVRNADRAAETGRYVPIDVLLKAHQGFSEGFRAYADAVDHAELWDNSGDGGPTLIAGKAPGGELEVLDDRAFADFERKAELDPMAAGPDSLFPQPDHAVTTAETTDHADQADHGAPAEQPAPPDKPDHPANHHSDIPPAPMPTVHDVLGDAFTSKQYRRALTDRARDVARHNGTTPEVELQQFVLLRAVSRIFAEAPDAWFLKGGLSFLVRFPDGRPTTDLDFIRLTEGGVERMAEDYNTALTRDHGDGLRFELDSSVPVAVGRGVRIGHRVFLGDDELMPLSADLVPNRTVPGRPESQTLWRSEEHPFPDQLFRFEGASEPENIRIFTLDGFLRQKLAAMYTYDKDAGLLPRRPNDLVDLALLAVKTSWDGPATHASVREEFDIRWEQGEKLHLPEEFANPNPAWVRVFADRAATTPGLPFTWLTDALPLLKKFIDPFLREEPPNADWDHRVMEWVPRDHPADVHGPQPARAGETIAAEGADRTTARTTGDTRAPGRPVAPLTRDIPADHGAIDPASVKLIAATGDSPPSTVFAEPSRIAEWDRLAAGGADGVAAKVSEVLADPTLPTLESKLRRINDDVLPVAGLPSRIESLDSKNLRFYSYMAGELFMHSSALMIDPHTTTEVGYHQGQVFRDYSKEAQARQLSYTGELPDGMTREQAAAVALWRSTKGLSTADVPPEELVHDFLTMHAQPLVDALTMRDRMINEYGIAPERIRLAYGGPPESDPGRGKSRMTRAHIHALAALRDDPEGARETMVRAMTGTGDVATVRDARAQAVVDRIDAAAEALGRSPDKIALLWVRDHRANPTANRNGLDTQPGVLRQLIELTRAEDPDRHIVLVGDDVFQNRTGLREAWEHDGVLTGVDTTTMVKFWDKDLNDGRALGIGEQALVFNKLLSRDVVQIGTESGALEIPFLLGMPTVYLENLVFHLNKGNRWLYMSQEWHYGRFEVDTGPTGSVRLDAAGHPVWIFHADRDPLPPPLPTVARVQFGPDLALPRDRQHVPTDFPQERVALTADRIYRLVESGELDNWAAWLGHEKSPADKADGGPADKADGGPADWTPEQWKRSEYYADQLQRWLHTDATPEDVSRKWDGIRLALRGVLDPGFDRDPEINNGTIVHPYFTLHTDHGVPPAEADLLARAYAAAPEERGAAVVVALKALLGDPGLRERAVRDELLFQLSAAELADLRESVARVLAASGRSAWGNDGDGAARADSGS
ncbi:zeta toxin family protein [Plantactinospora sonchi]|uniref:UDP-N-acetylglucosamine kinase n=1 Tax=Plantactinospora sonchi TaxID=1544735 RepID=A0ABU7RQW1_9ACTN